MSRRQFLHTIGRMAAAPTPQNLYKAVQKLYPGMSDDAIARELGLLNPKPLHRLKKGLGVDFPTAILLFEAVGWLDTDGEAMTRARLNQTKREMARLTQILQKTLDELVL